VSINAHSSGSHRDGAGSKRLPEVRDRDSQRDQHMDEYLATCPTDPSRGLELAALGAGTVQRGNGVCGGYAYWRLGLLTSENECWMRLAKNESYLDGPPL
jgi:hypothetical protein